jgi:hypothetical protein
MCGASLLNTDDTDVPPTISVVVVLALLLLTFQCSMTLGSSMCTGTVLRDKKCSIFSRPKTFYELHLNITLEKIIYQKY